MPTPTFSKIALRWSCTVHGEMCRRSAIAFVGEPLRDELRHGPLALGEAVGVGDQRRELVRPGGLDDHGRLRVVAVAERRAAHEQPAPGRRAHARAAIGARRGAPVAMLRARLATAVTTAGNGSPGVAVAQLGEPALGGGVGQRDRVVGREQDETGGVLVVRRSPDSAASSIARRSPSARCRDTDATRVASAGAKCAAVGAAQQRERAPRRRVVDQRGAQLVAEAVRPPELAMALAAVEVAARRRAEASPRAGPSGRARRTC